MIISAHQPAFLPWAGYLHRIAISDSFVILDDVQFEKNSFTNRNRIKGSAGPLWITVPVNLKGHMSGKIREVKIANDEYWAEKQLTTLHHAYTKSPYFDHHKEFFEYLYRHKWEYMVDMNRAALDYLLKQFKISTPIFEMSKLNISGAKQELIINLCKKFGANTFIFGTQGQKYMDKEQLNREGVVPLVHEYFSQPYPQLKGEFIPNLSVIDLLFNVHPDEINQRLTEGGKILA